jgi:hypothetical protein
MDVHQIRERNETDQDGRILIRPKGTDRYGNNLYQTVPIYGTYPVEMRERFDIWDGNTSYIVGSVPFATILSEREVSKTF